MQVLDHSIAPQHPGDHSPRLLIENKAPPRVAEMRDCGSSERSVRGRLLISPWSAFKGMFPMHGTYFFQNEVFEDETAGQVMSAHRTSPQAHTSSTCHDQSRVGLHQHTAACVYFSSLGDGAGVQVGCLPASLRWEEH